LLVLLAAVEMRMRDDDGRACSGADEVKLSLRRETRERRMRRAEEKELCADKG
jgi:hypothetical protein